MVDNLGQRGLEIVEFEVIKYWKGVRYTQSNRAMHIQRGNFNSNCSNHFELNKTYLVAEKPGKDEIRPMFLYTDVCMGTALVSQSKNFLAFLDTIPSYTPSIKYETIINKKEKGDALKVSQNISEVPNKIAIGSLILNVVLLIILGIYYIKRIT